MWKNKLYFGDCLDILRELHDQNKEGFIDLVYIDPPFNSKRNYNILFEEADLSDTKAQREAFADTWSNVSYKDTLNTLRDLDLDLFHFLTALDQIRISKSAIAYLTTMAIRIFYIHKVLKSTGSFYLHCDPTMSHYLKLVCDLIFSEKNFRNEIIWQRSDAHNDPHRYGSIHDVILFYSKSKTYKWNSTYSSYSVEYLEQKWNKTPDGKLYKCDDMTDPRKSMKEFDFMGTTARWRTDHSKMMELWNQEQTDIPYSHGRIKLTKEGIPRKDCKITFLDERPGVPIQDIWIDVKSLRGGALERLGYPTQKPTSLLERIISSSTNIGDIVADFFCGCGTTVDASQKLNRRWLGVDISHLAIGLIERRLKDTYGPAVKGTYEIHGFPKDISSAKMLAQDVEKGRFEFQKWIIEAEMGGICNPKKTADGGWDGHLTFDMQGEKNVILVEVKSGNVNVKNLREFIHVVQKQNADIGVFVCFAEQVTKPMRIAAKEEGYFMEPIFGTRYDRIQILSVDDILDDKTVQFPDSRKQTFKKAERKIDNKTEQQKLEL